MKNIILTISILISTIVYSQCNNIVHLDIMYMPDKYGEQGYYYKDINNVLNNFEGTYLFTNNTMSLKIKLQKKVMSSMNGVYCRDMIIGGVEYTKNSILQFNTIPLLNTYYEDGIKYKLSANNIYTGNARDCDECGVNEKWISGYITDPNSNQSCEIFIRRIIYNGQQAIKISMHIDITTRMYKEGGTPPPPLNLPTEDDMILIKQP
jgi:hypothetical protein